MTTDFRSQPAADGEVAELVGVLHEAAAADEWDGASPEWCAKLTRAAELLERLYPQPIPLAIPGEEYHDDMGAVTWWRLPVDEPPWVGSPNDSDWPGYHTHFTPAPPEPSNTYTLPLPSGEVE